MTTTRISMLIETLQIFQKAGAEQEHFDIDYAEIVLPELALTEEQKVKLERLGWRHEEKFWELFL